MLWLVVVEYEAALVLTSVPIGQISEHAWYFDSEKIVELLLTLLDELVRPPLLQSALLGLLTKYLGVVL